METKKTPHQPNLKTLIMVEKAILNSRSYPSRTMLWKNLPKKVEYPTFQRVLEYLEASGKITFKGRTIVYTGVDNPRLRELLESSVQVA